jgi:hypothetical protein
LPLLVGVIVAASITIIFGVRLFSDHLQMEWIASGQVSQFTTVMILLSCLMVLGLTNIVKEQVLWTLLGGIGGYVLARGVGRAASRSALIAQTTLSGAMASRGTSPDTTAPRNARVGPLAPSSQIDTPSFPKPFVSVELLLTFWVIEFESGRSPSRPRRPGGLSRRRTYRCAATDWTSRWNGTSTQHTR